MAETKQQQDDKDNENNPRSNFLYYLIAGLTGLMALGFVILIGRFLHYSITHIGDKEVSLKCGIETMLLNVSQWFDGIFFQYNLLLLSIAVAIPPLITLFYTKQGMCKEKKRRLRKEMAGDIGEAELKKIDARVDEMFELRHYLGSMSMLTLLVLMGGMIILLLKPLPIDGSSQFGVDYSKGANFLMLGPNMEYYVNNKTEEYMESLMGTLSAFQFGFLGAYVYFITHLLRSYFTLDLTPNTFVASSIRMMMGALLALVCAFLFLGDNKSVIPIISFFIGFFPQRGLLLIEKYSTAVFMSLPGVKNFQKGKYTATDLSQLPGMSFAHEVRLEREGYDNVENLTHADAVELAVRTGFGYKQLQQWISQATLMQQLGEDYRDFTVATGLTSIADIQKFFDNWQQQGHDQEPHEILMEAMPDARHKIRIISVVDQTESPDQG